jgi:hypothetical protein
MMLCPQCGSSHIHTSKRERWTDPLLRIRGRVAFRCHSCRLRFFALPSTEAAAEPAAQPKHRHRSTKISPRTKKRLIGRLVVFLIFAAAFVVFWFFLRYLTTERIPPQDSGAIRSSCFNPTA